MRELYHRVERVQYDKVGITSKECYIRVLRDFSKETAPEPFEDWLDGTNCLVDGAPSKYKELFDTESDARYACKEVYWKKDKAVGFAEIEFKRIDVGHVQSEGISGYCILAPDYDICGTVCDEEWEFCEALGSVALGKVNTSNPYGGTVFDNLESVEVEALRRIKKYVCPVEIYAVTCERADLIPLYLYCPMLHRYAKEPFESNSYTVYPVYSYTYTFSYYDGEDTRDLEEEAYLRHCDDLSHAAMDECHE